MTNTAELNSPMVPEFKLPALFCGRMSCAAVVREVLTHEMKDDGSYDMDRVLQLCRRLAQRYPENVRKDVEIARSDVHREAYTMKQKRGILTSTKGSNQYAHKVKPETPVTRKHRDGTLNKSEFLARIIKEEMNESGEFSRERVLDRAREEVKSLPNGAGVVFRSSDLDNAFARVHKERKKSQPQVVSVTTPVEEGLNRERLYREGLLAACRFVAEVGKDRAEDLLFLALELSDVMGGN